MGDNPANTELYDSDGEFNPKEAYEEKLRSLVSKDFSNAKSFLHDVHNQCVESYQSYYNAQSYEDLRKENRFPVSMTQRRVDEFKGNMLDKIFYKNRPCTIIGREETDKEDADAKQEMLDYHDYQDKIYNKMSNFVQDCGLYRFCVAQIDYDETYQRKVVGVEEPMNILNEEGAPVLDPMGNPIPQLDGAGNPVMNSRVEARDVPIFKGATVKRVDPINFFFTQDKATMDDEHPAMIRSFPTKNYFKSKKYFINIEKIDEEGDEASDNRGAESPMHVENKRMAHGLRPDQMAQRPKYTYIEWHGMLNKRELYEYLGYSEEDMALLLSGDEDEKTRAIVGVVNDKVVVRLEETPYDFNAPNIVIGVIQGDEDELIGTSICDKIYATHKGQEALMGILLENFKQSVDAMWIINTNAIVGGGASMVNKAGTVLETNANPNDVAKRVEQPGVAKDIYVLHDMFENDSKQSSGLENLIGGRGEPAAETLGESQIVVNQASLRMINYLKSFEEFIQALYDMRNQINMQFLDTEYIYGVIGEGAIEWRPIQPEQIRANVDFICESSSRETNRAVITQQIIQLAEITPMAQQMGFPIRFDKLISNLCEQGFSWTQEKIEEILPSLKLEKQGVPIDEMLMQRMMIQLQVSQLQAAMGGMPPEGGGQPGGQSPEPNNENEAIESANARNQTQVGGE